MSASDFRRRSRWWLRAPATFLGHAPAGTGATTAGLAAGSAFRGHGKAEQLSLHAWPRGGALNTLDRSTGG